MWKKIETASPYYVLCTEVTEIGIPLNNVKKFKSQEQRCGKGPTAVGIGMGCFIFILDVPDASGAETGVFGACRGEYLKGDCGLQGKVRISPSPVVLESVSFI